VEVTNLDVVEVEHPENGVHDIVPFKRSRGVLGKVVSTNLNLRLIILVDIN